jgi:hypothetical protein
VVTVLFGDRLLMRGDFLRWSRAADARLAKPLRGARAWKVEDVRPTSAKGRPDVSPYRLVLQLGAPESLVFSDRFAGGSEVIGVVDQAIQDGIRERRIPDRRMPVLGGQLTRDDARLLS